jgi:hypothetical protein
MAIGRKHFLRLKLQHFVTMALKISVVAYENPKITLESKSGANSSTFLSG